MHMKNAQKNNLWVHLASFNFPDSQLCLESKTEPRLEKAPNYMEGGGTPNRKNIYWGGHRTYFLDGGNNWGWDTVNIERHFQLIKL